MKDLWLCLYLEWNISYIILELKGETKIDFQSLIHKAGFLRVGHIIYIYIVNWVYPVPFGAYDKLIFISTYFLVRVFFVKLYKPWLFIKIMEDLNIDELPYRCIVWHSQTHR